MADYIPLKIQAEIMKRLPVISLIRFRSVSKQWKSVIDSPKFIADHCVIQHRTHESQHILLSYKESGVSSMGYVDRYFSIVDDDTFPHQKVFMTSPVSVNPLKYPTSIVGVSGGLFCIYGPNRNIMNAVICNPSIKKTVTIVVPNVPHDDGLPYNTIVGFGVCPRTSDPKLVKITFNCWYQEDYATIPNQVEVFSLSSGLWKPPSSNKLPRKSIAYMYPQVPINEFMYWLAYDMCSLDWKDQYCHLIMSFDLTSEEFTQVYLPQSLASSKTHVCISKLKESLVVLEKNHASNTNVWIMQNGDPKSFTHIFTINMPITKIRDVAGFRNNGAPIIADKKNLKENELIVYEPNSKQINYTGIAGPFHFFFASPYTQTLLLLDHKDSVDSETATATGIGKQVKAKTISFKTDQEILDKVLQSTNRSHLTGTRTRLLGTGGSSSRRSSQPSQGYCTQEEVVEMMRQHELEQTRLRKQVEENAKVAASAQNAINHFFDFFNRQQAATCTSSQYTPPQMYTPQVFPGPSYTTPDHGCYNPAFDPMDEDDGDFDDDYAEDDGDFDDDDDDTADDE